MFSISNNGIVRVNRGDSFAMQISLRLGNVFNSEVYTLKDSDAVYVGILEPNQRFEDAIVKKKLSAQHQAGEHIVAKFRPIDTLNLMPGKYFYQAKLETTNKTSKEKDVQTIVDKTLLFIEE